VVVIRDPWLGVDGYELHVPAGQSGSVTAGLTAEPVGPEALDAVRIEAGVPIDGVDLGEDTIPMEARLEGAIDFAKGCYIGQEVISRATNLGGVKHILVGFDIAGDEPPPSGARVSSGGKETGEVTSAVMSPTLGRLIGIGYVHKKDEIAGNPVTIEQDGKSWEATVANLPFVG
jgi:folate-binding protein YgfZ